MTDRYAPVWLAALTPVGELSFLDVSELIDEPGGVRAAVARQCGGYVDRVRVHTRAGWMLVYFREPRWESRPLQHNAHARKLMLDLGVDVGVYRGSVLLLGERDDREAGLSQQQQDLLRRFLDPHPSTTGDQSAPARKELVPTP